MGGHNRNFDVVVSEKDGRVYIANFEGLLSFDHSTWQMAYTPGYSRITRLFMDSGGVLWAGGYNIVAQVVTDGNRRTALKPLVSDVGQSRIGEVQEIFEEENRLFFRTKEQGRYEIAGDTVRRLSKSYHYTGHAQSPGDDHAGRWGGTEAVILFVCTTDGRHLPHAMRD